VESRTGLEVGQFIVCSKNHPISITILPHGTYHTCLVLHRSNVGQRKTSGKFRIGFPYVNPAVYFNIGGGDFISSLDERGNTYLKEGAYMLWSNYLTIEKSDPLHKD
jgi:hypothetical protein